MLPNLSIVIPNYNGEKLIPKFLPSVIQAVDNYKGEKEIIIADDNSSDNSIQEIEKFGNKITLIKRKDNGGFSQCCNSGISASSGDIIFLLNTDVELQLNFFDFFPKYFEDKDTFAVTVYGIQYTTREKLDGGKVLSWKRGNIRTTENYYIEDHPNLKAPYLSFSAQGAYFFIDKKKLDMMGGGLDDIYSPYIFEETDICYRAQKRGWKIYYEPKMVGYHDHSTTINSIEKKNKVKIISTRNRLFFTWINIHSPKLFASHIFFLILRLITLNKTYWISTYQALSQLKLVLQKRKYEKSVSNVSDDEILANIKIYLKK